MGVSKNNGIPKSSILIGFSITNHPFWGTPIFGNTHLYRDYNKLVGGLTNSKSTLKMDGWKMTIFCWEGILVSWWLNHPFEKQARQIGTFPQVGVKVKKSVKPHLIEFRESFHIDVLMSYLPFWELTYPPTFRYF